jgi:RNA polymerase sigma-70 factor (ECF subfamily)
MSNGTAGAVDLMDHLLGAYDELKRRLVRKLGSEELAGDACRTPGCA